MQTQNNTTQDNTTMQIQCTLNQQEAIRRGFSASSSVKIEVDVSQLTQEEREELAYGFKEGKYSPWHNGFCKTEILEPTINGLRETLAANIAGKAAFMQRQVERAEKEKEKEEKEKEERAKQDEINIAKLREQFDADPKSVIHFSSGYKPQCRIGLSSDQSYVSDHPYFHKLLDEPRVAIFNEIAAIIIKQEEIKRAEEEAKKEQAAADKIAAIEKLRQWSIANGSELLRLRAEENMQWQSLAEKEYCVTAMKNVGIIEPTLSDPEGFEYDDYDNHTKATVNQIKKLRTIREALAKIDDPFITGSSVCIELMHYKQENEYTEDERITRPEIEVTVTFATGDDILFYFAAE